MHLTQRIRVIIVRSQSGPLGTKESVLPVCDIPYNTNKSKVRKGNKIKVLQKFAFE